MRGIRTIFTLGVTACVLATVGAMPAAADPILATVQKRGELLCGVNGQLPGFSTVSDNKEWAGLEVDFCRAIAAATLGDAKKVKFIPVTVRNRFDLLRDGQIDVLFRNSIMTLERTVKTGVRAAWVYYFDGQAIVVPKKLGFTGLSQLAGHSICYLNSSPYGRVARDWFRYRNMDFKPLTFDTQNEMYRAFYSGKCDGLTQQVSAITTTIVSGGKATDYLVLPEIVANNPLAAFVRAGDEDWLDIVRWTFNALLDAEERGITQANVDSQRQTGTVEARRLLGDPADDGKLLGLSGSWAYDAIKQAGNYSEIFERNLGRLSPFKFPRAVNALWTAGGVMHPLPLR
ncbi:MAG: amino acid ABC transporter substrate-binding protein [Proteobacteria bacterium]|nr:amino acid ABC transporter substrate-binding protein [Pseudomonadota bacterium]